MVQFVNFHQDTKLKADLSERIVNQVAPWIFKEKKLKEKSFFAHFIQLMSVRVAYKVLEHKNPIDIDRNCRVRAVQQTF